MKHKFLESPDYNQFPSISVIESFNAAKVKTHIKLNIGEIWILLDKGELMEDKEFLKILQSEISKTVFKTINWEYKIRNK